MGVSVRVKRKRCPMSEGRAGAAQLGTAPREEVRAWLVNQISRLTGRAAAQVDASMSTYELGVDSVSSITLTSDLEEVLGRAIPPTLLMECDSLEGVLDILMDAPGPSGGSSIEEP